MVEGYENPVAGVTRSADKETNDDEDDDEDEEISTDAGTSTKKKKSKASSPSSSSKSISILSRTATEFDTCSPEKSVEFDPVQGKHPIPLFFSGTPGLIYYSLL